MVMPAATSLAGTAAYYHGSLSSHLPIACNVMLLLGLPIAASIGGWLLAGREPPASHTSRSNDSTAINTTTRGHPSQAGAFPWPVWPGAGRPSASGCDQRVRTDAGTLTVTGRLSPPARRSSCGFGPSAAREEGQDLVGVAGHLRLCEAGDEVSERHGLIDQEGVVGQEPGGHRCVEFGVA